MCKLTNNQIKVLELLHRGVNKAKIKEITKLSLSTVNDAAKRGKRNISIAIDTIKVAVEKGFISNTQISELKKICSKI